MADRSARFLPLYGSFRRMLTLALTTDLLYHGNEILDKIGYKSVSVRDICEIFAYIGEFTGMGHSMLQIIFSPDRPRLPCQRNLGQKLVITRLVTACAVATSCCISDVPSQWEGRNFDPHSSHIFQPILMKLETKKHLNMGYDPTCKI